MLARTNKYLALLTLLAIAFTGCKSLYYNSLEKVGYPKRDLLVNRVEVAKDTQVKAKDQFLTAMDQFKTLVEFDGGDLEQRYNVMNKELQRCESRAKAVTEKINGVENVANVLFKEWETELDQYHSKELRASSEEALERTRKRYAELMIVMRDAEIRMVPVLDTFGDQVLFLKHNLNARAIESLGGTAKKLELDVDKLVADLEKSIREADLFINAIEADQKREEEIIIVK